jgi:hypothetical protein
MNKTIVNQIENRISHIKANIHNMQNARAAIIEDLIYLSDHKKELKAVTGKTFDEIVKELTGFSRRYLNQLVSNYKYLETYGKLELFNTIDVKAIEHVKKQNRPELLDRPEKLTRPKSGDRLPIVDAEIIDQSGHKTGDRLPKSDQVQKAAALNAELTDNMDARFINQFYAMKNLDAFQLEKICIAIVGDVLHRTRGKDRAAIIGKVKKILKDYK